MLFNQEKQSSSPEHAEIVTERISEIQLSVQIIKSLKPVLLKHQSETNSTTPTHIQNSPSNRLSELQKAYQEVRDAFAA